MSARTNLWGGTGFLAVYYASLLVFSLSALGFAGGFHWGFAALLAAPLIAAAALSYRRNPQGLWWLASMAVHFLLYALAMAGLVLMVMTGSL